MPPSSDPVISSGEIQKLGCEDHEGRENREGTNIARITKIAKVASST
jgi:hypothetical protein